jgi:hypothetical protein
MPTPTPRIARPSTAFPGPAPRRTGTGTGSFAHALGATREPPGSPAGEPSFGLAFVRERARRIQDSSALVDRAVRAARAGRAFRPEELLALQAGVYRHSQELDLASKLVDKGTSSVRQLLQSQQ